MKTVNLFKILSLLIILSLLSCKKKEIPSVGDSADFALRANYIFETDGDPTLTLVPNESSSEILIGNNPEVSYNSGRILFSFNGVTIKNGQNVYRVNKVENNFDVQTQRFQNGDWNDDNENFLNIQESQSLDVVLILDVSQSLGENLEVIKQRAIQFVNTVFQNNSSAKIGVVKFSRGFDFLELSGNLSQIQNFILSNSQIQNSDIGNYTLENRPETGLYQAMNKGLDILNFSDSTGKGLVTFTDGFNNYQTDVNFENPDYLYQQLNNSDISSYTIGFIGNQNTIETDILETLAVNGNFAFPQTTDELVDVFDLFSKSVAVVYDFIYNTNNSNQNSTIQYRFLLNTTLVSE